MVNFNQIRELTMRQEVKYKMLHLSRLHARV